MAQSMIRDGHPDPGRWIAKRASLESSCCSIKSMGSAEMVSFPAIYNRSSIGRHICGSFVLFPARFWTRWNPPPISSLFIFPCVSGGVQCRVRIRLDRSLDQISKTLRATSNEV